MVRGWRGFFVLLLAVYLGLISVYSLFVSGDVGQTQVQATTYTTITSITSTRTTVETQTITIISVVAVAIVTLATVISRFVWNAYRRAPGFQPPLPGADEASPDRLFYEVEADEDLSKLPSPEDNRFPGEEDGVQQDPESLKKRGPADRGGADSMRGGGGPEGGREVGEPGGGPSDSWSKGSREVSDVPGGSTGPSGGETDASSGGSRDVKADGGAGPEEVQKPDEKPLIPEPPTEPGGKSIDTTGDKTPLTSPAIPPPSVIIGPTTPPQEPKKTGPITYLKPPGSGGCTQCENPNCPAYSKWMWRREIWEEQPPKPPQGWLGWLFRPYVLLYNLIRYGTSSPLICPHCGTKQGFLIVPAVADYTSAPIA